MNLLQSGFPLKACNLGISDGQHVFSKPLFPSTSIIAVSIRSFTENSSGLASSFSKVALKASFFFVFVKGSLMMMMMMMKGERRTTDMEDLEVFLGFEIPRALSLPDPTPDDESDDVLTVTVRDRQL